MNNSFRAIWLAATFYLLLPDRLSAQSFAASGLFCFDKSPDNILLFHRYPSMLARLPSGVAGLYAEQPYLLDGLRNYYLGYGFCTEAGNMALLMQHQGNEYNQYQKISFTYGRNLGSGMEVGIQVHLHNERFSGYSVRRVLSGSLGCGFQLSASMRAGLAMQDPAFFLPEKNKTYRINSRYLSFIQYAFSKQLNVGCQFMISEKEQSACQIGLQYEPQPDCRLLLAVNTESGSVLFGLNYSVRRLRLLFSAGYHPVLGPTPSFGIMYQREGMRS
jgi:hypothetical protein